MRKAHLKSPHPNKKSKVASTPQTADDYQDLADEEEARGGKWRAGDPAKSARAFERAIAYYDRGLDQFPHDYDLAYNKARLELEITQQPALLPHWGLSLLDFLAQALQSHRRALKINDDDVDLLFNTAQVLTSLAEELANVDRDDDAIKCLHEALENLSACLSKQEMLLEQQSVALENEDVDDETGGVSLLDSSATRPSDSNATGTTTTVEESAVIIQPVTPSDLLDTVHASLIALTTLVGLENVHSLANLDGLAQTLYDTKAPSYLALIEPAARDDALFAVALDRAGFICALADAQFTAQIIEVGTLLASVESFNIPNIDTHADGLLAVAKAKKEVALSVLDRSSDGNSTPPVQCWKLLSQAQESLSLAAKLQDDIAKGLRSQIYLQKGDIEMVRIRIASLPFAAISEAIKNSRSTLLKNALTFYKGAAGHAVASEEQNLLDVAKQKSAVVQIMLSLDEHSQPVLPAGVQQMLNALVDEGLLDNSIVEQLAALSI